MKALKMLPEKNTKVAANIHGPYERHKGEILTQSMDSMDKIFQKSQIVLRTRAQCFHKSNAKWNTGWKHSS